VKEYLAYLARVFRFDFSVYNDLPRRPFLAVFLNLFLAGLIYGGSSLYFNLGQMREIFTDAASINIAGFMIVLSGIALVFLAQAGSSLFIWTFCRGVGGNTSLINYYVGTGMAVPVFWIALPFFAALGADFGGSLFNSLAVVVTVAAAVSLVASIKEASGLTAGRLFAALLLTLIFVGSFLYLWLV
jgi:hypothetical protein